MKQKRAIVWEKNFLEQQLFLVWANIPIGVSSQLKSLIGSGGQHLLSLTQFGEHEALGQIACCAILHDFPQDRYKLTSRGAK